MEFWIIVFYTVALVTISAIDLASKRIPNSTTYPTIIVSLLIDLALYHSAWYLLAGAIGFSFLALMVIIGMSKIGMGDMKLALLAGLMVGFPNIILVLLFGTVAAGIVAVVMVKRKKKDTIPFGPFLSGATIIALLFGANIWGWYFRL